MCVHHVCACWPWRSEEWVAILWTEVLDGEPLCCSCQLNFGPLQVHQFLSSTGASSSLIIFFLSWVSLNNAVFTLAVVAVVAVVAADDCDLLVLLPPLPQHSEFITVLPHTACLASAFRVGISHSRWCSSFWLSVHDGWDYLVLISFLMCFVIYKTWQPYSLEECRIFDWFQLLGPDGPGSRS